MGLLKRIQNIWNKLVTDILPIVWGICIVLTITALTLGATYWSIDWLFSLIGVF